ncbi:hypothetical protein PYCC9005_005370 [Savitreella phatthalungensis]
MRIVVLGDPCGDSRRALARLEKLVKQGDFDLAIILGALVGKSVIPCISYKKDGLEGDAPGLSLSFEGQDSCDIALYKRGGPLEKPAGIAQYSFQPGDKFQETTGACRSIVLADIGNDAKQKWFYAFNLTSKEIGSKKRRHQEVSRSYKCQNCGHRGQHLTSDCRQPQKFDSRAVDSSRCFFCLSNPKLSRHLIVSVGKRTSYLTLPKGALTPDHVLVVPVKHAARPQELVEDLKDYEEEERHYIDALAKLYELRGNVPVVFRIARQNGVHFHTQVVPVSAKLIPEIVDGFHAAAAEAGLELLRNATDSFVVVLPTDEIHMDISSKPFDLQLGRRVIADVTEVPERAMWKDCIRSVEQETADAARFKAAFRQFDPYL